LQSDVFGQCKMVPVDSPHKCLCLWMINVSTTPYQAYSPHLMNVILKGSVNWAW
jgi:hypothetical protein